MTLEQEKGKSATEGKRWFEPENEYNDGGGVQKNETSNKKKIP